MDPARGVSKHLGGLDACEHRVIFRSTAPESFVGFDNRVSGATLLSESGLYKLALRSTKPQAKPFQDWVTKVVLPAIRKDGMYVTGEEKVDVTTDEGLAGVGLVKPSRDSHESRHAHSSYVRTRETLRDSSTP